MLEFPWNLHAGAARSRDSEGSIPGMSMGTQDAGLFSPPLAYPSAPKALPEAAGAAQSSLEGLVLPKMPKASALRRQLGSSRKLIRRYPALSCPSTGWDTGDRQEGLFQRGRAKGKGLAGHNIPDREAEPIPKFSVPLGILLSARTGAREYSLDLWRERWEAGAAG